MPSITITHTSVFVPDQEAALRFYTEVLGFEKKEDVSMGEFRWLTVVSPAHPDGVELVLEPNQNPTAQVYQEALVAEGIPYNSMAVDDVDATFEELRGKGVRFTLEPTDAGPVRIAILDDTCGNLLQLRSQKS